MAHSWSFFVICALALLLAAVLCVHAMPQKMMEIDEEENEMETLMDLEEILEIIRKRLQPLKECINEAVKACENELKKGFREGFACVFQHIADGKGKCEHKPGNFTSEF
ncbi:uncharacterized protein LOC106642568 [Copidosoma floridanum]|uniref:uncharacterized protein LOC106642568 n=1 Tax=Copidosoma floridanum TaxID=29053 RepID=UPI0006C95D1C|nr:uncharacterized protein LOC106642568 [Copidosoma floridanum]